MERGERRFVALTLGRHNRRERLVHARELVESSYELYELARLQKDQPTIDVMVGEGTEGLVAKGDFLTQPKWFRRIEIYGGGNWPHGLVDPAESVDRDLFDEELLDVVDLVDR
jgi:hypothetical protein